MILLCLLICHALSLHAQAIDLNDGDRVVFLGNTLVERDALSGYLEARLIARYPDHNLVFRNLGWSGDTVYADARAGFDTRAEGFARLKEQIYDLEPTMIFVAYGGNEAFAGPAGIDDFAAGLNTLLDMLAETKARLILVTPPRQEQQPSPLPDPDKHNADLELYSTKITQIGAGRGLLVIDLFHHRNISIGQPRRGLTTNGLHFSPYGYWQYALAIEEGLGLSRSGWRAEFDVKTQNQLWLGTRLGEVEMTPTSVQFSTLDEALPAPLSPDLGGDPKTFETWSGAERQMRVGGLPEGRYELRIDGQPAASATAAEWASGVILKAGPEYTQIEQLCDVVRKKNEYYFHRWRPENDTYLFGFRKHEQGNNAVEVPRFDPLIAEQEAIIAQLRRPVPHHYELQLTNKPAVEPQSGQ